MVDPAPVAISRLSLAGGSNPLPQATDLVPIDIFNPNKFGPGVGGWQTYAVTLQQLQINAALIATGVFGPAGPLHNVGLVPDPGAVAGSTRFLCENATWLVPGLTGTRLAKATSYAVANSDFGNTIALSGAGQTLTFNAASGYDARFAVLVVNEDTSRAWNIAPNGVTPFFLYPGQAVVVFNQNNTWRTYGRPVRWRLNANLTLFIDTGGSDANDGLASGAANAFATIQKAYDTAADNFDLAGFKLTFQCAAGQTYTNNGLLTQKRLIGQANVDDVIFDGGGSTFLTNNGNHVFGTGVTNGAIAAPAVRFMLQNIVFGAVTGGGSDIAAEGSEIVLGTGITFGSVASPGAHMLAFDPGGLIVIRNNYAINGGANCHVQAGTGRLVALNNITVTLSGTPAFNIFIDANDTGRVTYDGCTFSGAATGQRYRIRQNSLINKQATTATFFPGDSAGTIQVGCTYGGVSGTNNADNALAGDIGEYISSIAPRVVTPATVTITIASPAVITWAGHPFVNTAIEKDFAPITFATTGALPTGLTAGTVYYVIPSTISGNNFSVATSVDNAIAGTAVNTSGTQSGTQTATASIPLSTGTAVNITALSLTAGDWEVSGVAWFAGGATTTVNFVLGALNTVSATPPSSSLSPLVINTVLGAGATMFNFGFMAALVPTVRFSLAATTTIYLVGNASFGTSTALTWGAIRAQRAR